jgi:hypothetical protein
MRGSTGAAWRWLILVVLVHLLISMVHGAAHAEAEVPLSRAATLFVYIVILAGPLAGIGLAALSEQVAVWVIAFTLAGSFVFGLLNHFVLAGPDHVAQVALPWRALFAATAVLLAVIELAGSGLAFAVALRGKRS